MRIINIQHKPRNKYVFLLVVFMFFLLTPAYLKEIEGIKFFLLIGKLLTILCGIIFFVLNLRKRSNLFTIEIEVFLYFAFLFFITFILNGDVEKVLKSFISSISAVSIICFIGSKSIYSVIYGLLIFFEILIYGNFISTYFYPSGLYIFRADSGWWSQLAWFLGLRNGMTPFYIIGSFLELIYYEINKKLCRVIVFFVTCLFTICLINKASLELTNTSSGGLIIIWLLIVFYFVIKKYKNLFKFVDFKTVFFLNVFIAVSLILFDIQQHFSYLLEELLHKSSNLSSRTEIWNYALDSFISSPIWGNGVEFGADMAHKLRNAGASDTTQNGYLDILYFGGLISFILFLLIIFTVIKNIKKNHIDNSLKFLISYFSFIYFMSGQMESLVGTRFFIFLSIIAVITAQSIQKTKDQIKRKTLKND